VDEAKALAMMEFKSIGWGLATLDRLLKGFPVELIFLRILCPGKLLAAVTGEIAAVRGALQRARENNLTYIDDFFLGNPHPGLLAAVRDVWPVELERLGALGIIETFTASSALVAADTACKAGAVTLANLHMARGLAGKAHVYLTGSVGAVEVALEAVEGQLEPGSLSRQTIIPSPDMETWRAVL